MLDGEIYGRGHIGPRLAGPASAEVDRLARLGVATISSALAGPETAQRLLDGHQFVRVAGSGAVAGGAVTVWNPPGSNRMTFPALATAEPGDILVISGDQATAAWGEVAATLAKARGLAGVLLDGALRDLERVAEIGLPTWTSRIWAGQGFRAEPGMANVPVTVRGLLVRPGDVLVIDDDGVLALPGSLVGLALQRGEAKAAD
jgi:4-hydroxy-4-methyl-2-oxoglutarate aldolase